jgi:ELWxxDGT repeat protein
VNLGGTLYFAAGDAGHGRELWKSDGTTDGTVVVRDVVPGPVGSEPDGLVAVGRTLFFRVVTPAGTELWKSDGTESGTVRVAALSPRPADYYVPPRPARSRAFTPGPWGAAVNGALIFANGGPDGAELWRSDGTEAGTVRVSDIEPGPAGSNPSGFVELNGRVYFGANDHETGRELWSTDGTAAGTARVQDIYPGAVGSSPTWLTPSGGALWFSAAGREVGRELWKYATAPPPATVVGRYAFYNSSAFDGGDAAASAADDNAIAPDKVALLAGQDRLPGFDNVTSYSRGLNGLMIDVAGLPVIDALLDADDFDFDGAGAPVSVTVRPGAGVNGSDRVTLVWRDYNPLDASPLPQALANGWLTVTVKANAHTGLAHPDVFSFGNLIGETGDSGGAAGWRVSALDLGAVKKALNSAAGVTATTDFNRDGRINALDLALAKRELNRSLSRPPAVDVFGNPIRSVAEELGLLDR